MLLKQAVQVRASEVVAVDEHGFQLPHRSDIYERIGPQQEQVSPLADRHRPARGGLAQKARGLDRAAA